MIQPMIEIATVLSGSGMIDFTLLCTAVLALDLFRACGGVLYLWESAKHYWHALAPRDEVLEIRRLFADTDQGHITPLLARKVADWLRSHPKTQADFHGNRNQHLINFSNGTYDFLTGKLREYRKDDLLTNVLDAEYIEGSGESSVLRAFCTPVFAEAMLVQKERLLYQYIGYIVSNLSDAKKAIFMIGPANCGKSVFLNFLELVLGREAVSRISLANLADRFSTAELAGKVANLSGEVPVEAIPARAYNLFKALVGHDPVTAERKGKDPFVFTFMGTLVFAGNVLPEFKAIDGSEALLSRMALLVFNQGIPEGERDREALEKLYKARHEIISFAVDTIRPLIDSGYQFDMGEDEHQALSDYKDMTNTVQSFLNTCCKLDEKGLVYISKAYEMYKKYVEYIGGEPESRASFKKKMLCNPRVKVDRRHRIDGEKPKICFRGIKSIDISFIAYDVDQDTNLYDNEVDSYEG